MKLLSIGKFSKLIGISAATLRRWHTEGSFIPCFVSKGGTRYYSEEQLESFKGDQHVLNQESKDSADT